MPNSTGLTAKGGDVWVAVQLNGTIVQIIDDGVKLNEPVVAFDGLAGPEGLDIRHNVSYVVEGGGPQTQTLTIIHLKSENPTRRTFSSARPSAYVPFADGLASCVMESIRVDCGATRSRREGVLAKSGGGMSSVHDRRLRIRSILSRLLGTESQGSPMKSLRG